VLLTFVVGDLVHRAKHTNRTICLRRRRAFMSGAPNVSTVPLSKSNILSLEMRSFQRDFSVLNCRIRPLQPHLDLRNINTLGRPKVPQA
jgi:hypothetical protein